jgi:3-oxo-5-alpha-steroid 4-dehydrogenase 1
MNSLLAPDLPLFNFVLMAWGALGILSALAIYLTKLMPMSSRVDNSSLAFFGTIDKKLGWIIMETSVLISVLYFYLASSQSFNVSLVFIAVFVIHYSNRALIFPHRIKVSGKTMPISIMLSSMSFYAINGYLIGVYFGALRAYPIEWLWDPRFILGLSLFAAGMAINLSSDNILIRLRKPGETGYKIPHGGAFRYVSCPNYFGEILEWIGFAVMSWSLLGVVYALWVALPLIAQGLQTHAWYLERFQEQYPKRKAIIPCLL